MALTRKQTALIHVAIKQLGLSEERYRHILRTMADVKSSKDLDQTGFSSQTRWDWARRFKLEYCSRPESTRAR